MSNMCSAEVSNVWAHFMSAGSELPPLHTMAGTSKALEFPSDVVFQRLTDSREEQLHLHSQLDDLLQQLLQLASTLQTFAEHNRAVSQQLQLSYGATSKVAEKLMLAHCEQELAQRARIVSETRATVQLPPFAQVMQQISDHVRQEFTAMGSLYAQQPQYPHPSVPAYTIHRSPIDGPPRCYYPSHCGYGQSPGHAANRQSHPVYATDALQHMRAEPCSVNQAHLAASRPLFMPSHSMYRQQVSPQQMLSSNHSLPAAPHQVYVPLSPGVQHPQNMSFVPPAPAAQGQPASQFPQGSFQHTSSASELHGHPLWQHPSPALPHGSSAALHHAAVSAAASPPASACCPDQPQRIMAPGHVAAAVASPDQVVGAAHSASISQPDGLIPCQNQSMLVANDHMQLQHAVPMTAALCTGTSDPPVPLKTRACGAAMPPAASLTAPTHPEAVIAAMPLTQETPSHSIQHSVLLGQHREHVQQQEHPSLLSPSGKRAPHSLPAPEPTALGESCAVPPGVQPTGTGSPIRATGFSSLLLAVEQGQPATSSAAATASAGTTNAGPLSPHTCAAGSISFQYPTAAACGTAVLSPTDMMPLPQRAPAHAAPPAGVMEPPGVPERIAPPGDLLLATPISAQHLASPVVKTGQATPQLRRGSDSCASIGHQGAAASLPAAVGQTGLLTEQVASEGSFRFQPQPDCVQGVSAGVCCTPVLRPRSQQAAHAGDLAPAVAAAVTKTAIGVGHSPQPEVLIPDSEESPGRCSEQRRESHPVSPPCNGGALESPGHDASLVSLQHSMAKQSSGQHSSAGQAMSGCSMEALPRRSQSEAGLQSPTADQRAAHTLGCGLSQQVVSQQPTGLPQSLTSAAAACQHALDAGAKAVPAATAAVAASAVAASDPAANALGWVMAQSSTWSGCNPNARSGLEPRLPLAPQATPMSQRTDAALPGFGDPTAPAPAGPTEHLGADQTALGIIEEPLRASDDQQGVGQEPVGVQARRVAGANQRPSRAQQLEGSQPSSSSLKRVPETPDSAENRSQPTQSPNGNDSSPRGAAQSGPLHVVLVNNSDEQAGTQGVNVAAFLLMDSQKDSTSPGHAKTAQPAQGVQEGGVMPAASTAIGNSQTQQQELPMVCPSKTNTRQTTRYAKASTRHTPQQHISQPVGRSVTGQQALQAATAGMPGAEGAAALPTGTELGMTPANTGTPDMPAGSAGMSGALKQSTGKQKCPRWPGSCSQGPVADANRLHGVAAVAVPPRRSKSCSTGKRQHTAKKLIFQQLSLAQQANSSPSCRAPAVTAAHRYAMDAAEQQPVVAGKQTAGAVAGMRLPSAETHVGPAEAGVAENQSGKGTVEAPLAGSGAVSAARQDAKAAAVCQKEGPKAPILEQHGPAGSDGQCLRSQADKASSGSQEQWESAISKLRRLAHKHSQDSQENAAPADTATDMTAGAGALQEQRPVPADEQPLGNNRNPAPLSSHLLHVAPGPSGGEKLQQQIAVLGRPAAVDPALPATGCQLALPTDQSGTGAQALQGEPGPGTGGYTALSQSEGVVCQEKQHQLETDPLIDTGQKPGSSLVATILPDRQQVQRVAPAQSPAQYPQQTPSMMPRQPGAMTAQQPGGKSAENAQKRKRLEPGAWAVPKRPHSEGEVASHMPAAQLPCKRQCLSASGHERSHSPAAQGSHSTERPSLVCGKRQTGAARPSGSGATDQRDPQQRTGTATVQDTAPLPCQLVAWPPNCEPNLACVGIRHGSQQLRHALSVTVAVRGGRPPAAPAEIAVKALVSEAAAAGLLVGPAAVLVPTRQQDESQGGSEPQQGGLRLDLSSEEDPLLCTQKLPSSQGNSGSGQGLFKTPDDSEGQGAALARVPPVGLANMQSPWMGRSSLALPSPWNTPALPQPPIPQPPPEPASICKSAGYPFSAVGHPAPPLSWMDSHEAVVASFVVPSGCDGNCKQTQAAASRPQVACAEVP